MNLWHHQPRYSCNNFAILNLSKPHACSRKITCAPFQNHLRNESGEMPNDTGTMANHNRMKPKRLCNLAKDMMTRNHLQQKLNHSDGCLFGHVLSLSIAPPASCMICFVVLHKFGIGHNNTQSIGLICVAKAKPTINFRPQIALEFGCAYFVLTENG